MAKIYPDTNRFVDLYQANSDRMDIFDELQKIKGSLVLTEQTVNEFRRNRTATVKWLTGEFRNKINVSSPFTTWIVQSLPGHRELTDLLKSYKSKGQEVLDQLKNVTLDEADDPVAQKFMALARDPAVTMLELSDDAVTHAQRRKLLGNPPTSPDKHTIGDEVIWELLLNHLKDDLIIVTKDHTYHENFPMLREEFHRRTNKSLLLVTDKFSEAISAIGQAPSEQIIRAEQKDDAWRTSAKSRCVCTEGPSPSGWRPNGRFLQVHCIRCGEFLAAQEDPDNE